MSEEKKDIVLIVGGYSPEREVSKDSGRSIYNALINLDYNVKIIDPAYGKNQPSDIEDFFKKEDFTEISARNYIEAINSELFDEVKLAFLGLHGEYGEDGLIQALLELRGVKYTGSKVNASSNAMNKIMSKILFNQFNIPTPKWIIADKNNFEINNIILNIKDNLGFPCVIKPNDQGSTVGLTICESEEQISDAITKALNYSGKALLEEYIAGKELTVAVLGKQVLPVLEIKPDHGLYDYECKYTSGKSKYVVPADIPIELFKEMQRVSLLAFKELGCSGYSRLDFRVTKDNRAYCLEINTLPGMTPTSLVPKMAKAIGISFDELVKRIIEYSTP